ncbi:hypothetical protein [Mucilaginibacter auburnensis]|uniref:Lipoprotein n=1 Tax=Mucilaginibacter auburnensis TaxID=1457233 RepID=A0A2H9VNU5_9SPHI|nr:hypothetical protein [Mucilaginibacter auburnensis]PJJ79986.1 hypothetical protein CLV57_3128 [Mucilaginibacter auburnensis]
MKWLSVIICWFVLMGCGAKKNGFEEVKGSKLVVQVKNMNSGADDTEISYQVKILPERSLTEKLSPEQKNNLWYKMDSCFYIQTEKIKVTPNLVQPIANGQSGNYEFMLSFPADSAINDASTLVYKDKYLNKETYNFKVNLKN